MHKQNPYFLLSLDGFNSEAERKAFAASSSDVADLIAWLLPQLRERGLGRLVLWGDNFSGDDAVGDMADLKELAKAGEADQLTLGCRCGVECADIDAMKSVGVEIWNVASACTSSWSHYETCYDSIQAIGELGREHPEFGQIADAMYDPAWVDHGQLLACYTWNPDAAEDMNGLLEQGIQARFGAFAHQYASAMQTLMKCLSENSALGVCFNRTEDPEAVKDYPMSALAALRGMPDAADQLKAAMALAKQAREEFAVVAEKPKEELNDFMAKAAGSLAGEAARIEALAGCFSQLLGNENTTKARKELVAGMKLMEKYKPRFLVPAALANMSPLLTFLDSKK